MPPSMRLNVLDYAYRAITFSSVAVGGWAVYAMWTVHADTLQRGRELMEKHAADKDFKFEIKKKEEAKEELLARQAVMNVYGLKA